MEMQHLLEFRLRYNRPRCRPFPKGYDNLHGIEDSTCVVARVILTFILVSRKITYFHPSAGARTRVERSLPSPVPYPKFFGSMRLRFEDPASCTAIQRPQSRAHH